MIYQEQPNPFLGVDGRPLPGKLADALQFAQAEQERYFNSLTPDLRKKAIARHRNFCNHQQSPNEPLPYPDEVRV